MPGKSRLSVGEEGQTSEARAKGPEQSAYTGGWKGKQEDFTFPVLLLSSPKYDTTIVAPLKRPVTFKQLAVFT